MDEDNRRTLTFVEHSIRAVTDVQAKPASRKKKNQKKKNKKRIGRPNRKDVFSSDQKKQEETFTQSDPVTKAADPGSRAADPEEKGTRKTKDSRIQHVPDKGKENNFASGQQKEETFNRPDFVSKADDPEETGIRTSERTESSRVRHSQNKARGALYEKTNANQPEKRAHGLIGYEERADPSRTNLSHPKTDDRVTVRSRAPGKNSRVSAVKEKGAAESVSKTGRSGTGSSGGMLVISGAKKTFQGAKRTVQRVRQGRNRVLQAGLGTSIQTTQNMEQQKQRLKQIGVQKIQRIAVRSGKKALRSTVKYSVKLLKAAGLIMLRIGILLGSLFFTLASPIIIILVLILGAAGGDTLDVNLPLPLYVTYDSRWGNMDYGPGTIYDCGSHVCSIAMAVSYVLDSEETPDKVLSWSGSDYYSPDVLDDRLFYAAADHYHLTILQFTDFEDAASELMQRQLHSDQRPVLLGITKPSSVFGDIACGILIDPDANWEYYTIYSPRDTRQLDLYYAPKSIDDVEAYCQQFYILDLDPD